MNMKLVVTLKCQYKTCSPCSFIVLIHVALMENIFFLEYVMHNAISHAVVLLILQVSSFRPCPHFPPDVYRFIT